jgi:hypothetical protein
MHQDTSPTLFASTLISDNEADVLEGKQDNNDILSGDTVSLEGDTGSVDDGFKANDTPEGDNPPMT